ncbi:MAG: hypothetical protein JWM74_3673 [Myxococcaceae bacterium]|nr:hypothetical protein [Myxococcaceae bacterium]
MALIAFVQNYEDLSTDRGFQFKFHCDKCGNGHMSRFEASVVGTAGSLLRAAGGIFGGFLSSAGDSAYEVQQAVGGKAHDDALEAAVKEAKVHFHQCSRCGRWVCPDVCWNGAAGQCEECAPNFQEEMASAHAQAKAAAAREQLHEKARATDYVGNVDMGGNAVQRAPGPQTAAGDACTGCGTSVPAANKFCPNCGIPKRPAGCPSCSIPIVAGTKFCGGCGAKLL